MRLLFLLALLSASSSHAKSPPAVEAAAKGFAQHINDGESGKAATLIDVDALVDRAIEGIADPQGLMTEIRKGFRPAIEKFAEKMSETVEDGGSFTLLGMRTRDGKEFSLYRVITAEGGLNYIEVEWRSRGGLVRGIDIESAIAGESMGTTLRQKAASEASGDLIDRPSGKEARLKSLLATGRFISSARSGQLEKAMSLYRALPAEQQREKMILGLRMRVAREISEDEYLKAMEDMIRHYPHDTGTLLASLEFWFHKKDFNKIRGLIAKLDARVGGDPFLDVYRAITLIAEEKLGGAKKSLERAVVREPTLADAWFLLVEVSVLQNTHAETARLLDAATKAADIEWSGIPDEESFAAFRSSKQGKAWLARLPKAPAPEADRKSVV